MTEFYAISVLYQGRAYFVTSCRSLERAIGVAKRLRDVFGASPWIDDLDVAARPKP